MKGWGPKSSVCPSKPRESNFFGGISLDLAWISEAPEKFEKKMFGFNFWPLGRIKNAPNRGPPYPTLSAGNSLINLVRRCLLN